MAKGYQKTGRKYWAHIMIDGKDRSLGGFDTEAEAAAAYAKARAENPPHMGMSPERKARPKPVYPKPTSRGVYRNHRRFNARINIGGKVINLGAFATEEEAAAAYNAADAARPQGTRPSGHGATPGEPRPPKPRAPRPKKPKQPKPQPVRNSRDNPASAERLAMIKRMCGFRE